jgi:hypothetical protein
MPSQEKKTFKNFNLSELEKFLKNIKPEIKDDKLKLKQFFTAIVHIKRLESETNDKIKRINEINEDIRLAMSEKIQPELLANIREASLAPWVRAKKIKNQERIFVENKRRKKEEFEKEQNEIRAEIEVIKQEKERRKNTLNEAKMEFYEKHKDLIKKKLKQQLAEIKKQLTESREAEEFYSSALAEKTRFKKAKAEAIEKVERDKAKKLQVPLAVLKAHEKTEQSSKKSSKKPPVQSLTESQRRQHVQKFASAVRSVIASQKRSQKKSSQSKSREAASENSSKNPPLHEADEEAQAAAEQAARIAFAAAAAEAAEEARRKFASAVRKKKRLAQSKFIEAALSKMTEEAEKANTKEIPEWVPPKRQPSKSKKMVLQTRTGPGITTAFGKSKKIKRGQSKKNKRKQSKKARR